MLAGQPNTLVVQLIENPLVSEIVFSCMKPTEVAFTNYDYPAVLTQDSYYKIDLPSSFCTLTGTYVFKIETPSGHLFQEVDVVPTPLNSILPPDVCLVIGNIRNLSAQTEVYGQRAVTAKPAKLPVITSGTMVLGGNVTVYTNYAGEFQLPLIKGVNVIIEVSDVGVRFQTTVPMVDVVRIEQLIPV